MTIDRVTIGFHLGATLNIDGINWAKPSNHVSIEFTDGIPPDEELKDAWDWIVQQITKQADDLFDIVKEHIRQIPQIATPSAPWKRPVTSQGAPPPGGRYE